MKTCTKCKLEKELFEFTKQKASPDGHHHWCKECTRKASLKWNKEHKSIICESVKKYIQNHPERVRAAQKAYSKTVNGKRKKAINNHKYYLKNTKKIKDRLKLWNDKHPDVHKKSSNSWRKKDPGKHIEQVMRRYADKIMATPCWANKEKIREFYRKADKLSKKTGIKYHVDHMIPLKHKLVCGLHVETNLQVIPASNNIRKNNYFVPGLIDDVLAVAMSFREASCPINIP